MSRVALSLAASVGLAAAPAALAHEVLHEIERNRAIAVRAYFADGEVLGGARYEVYAPSDRGVARRQGRTDPSGWLAFVPDAPGRWRVKVVDASGHGLDVEVDAGAPAAPPAAGAARSSAAFVLRPVVGLAAIGAVFGALVLARRRKRSSR